MTNAFFAYSAFSLLAIGAALAIVRVRRAFRIDNMVGWYLLVFFLTYVLRPAGAQWIGDNYLQGWLNLSPFEEQWQRMTVAVCLAVLSFAFAYRFGARSHRSTTTRPTPSFGERANRR